MELAGLGAALLASVMFNVGIVLQAIDARAAPRALGLRPGLLVRLFQRPLWLLGGTVGVLGVIPQAFAYAKAPFVIVQPMLAVGLLLVLVLGSRILGEPVTGRELAGVLAIIGGVALVAWGAPPHSELHRAPADVLAVFATLAVVGLAPFVLRGTRLDRGLLLIVATGCGFAATNVATKLVGDNYDDAHWANAAFWGVAVLGMGVSATLVNMSAFQRRPATIVVPVSTAVQTFLPIVLEPFFLRERWGAAGYDGVPMAAGLALAFAGIVLVAAAPSVGGLMASGTAAPTR